MNLKAIGYNIGYCHNYRYRAIKDIEEKCVAITKQHQECQKERIECHQETELIVKLEMEYNPSAAR
jgi:hypothetical protein